MWAGLAKLQPFILKIYTTWRLWGGYRGGGVSHLCMIILYLDKFYVVGNSLRDTPSVRAALPGDGEKEDMD